MDLLKQKGNSFLTPMRKLPNTGQNCQDFPSSDPLNVNIESEATRNSNDTDIISKLFAFMGMMDKEMELIEQTASQMLTGDVSGVHPQENTTTDIEGVPPLRKKREEPSPKGRLPEEDLYNYAS